MDRSRYGAVAASQPTLNSMNSTITFPPPEPALKLSRPSAEKWAATLAEERRRLQEDQEALREREKNLREYETRLRSLQAELEAGRSGGTPENSRTTVPPYARPATPAPFHEDPVLQAAWEKLHRAREILEAEQNHIRDDRIALRDQQLQVKQREEAVAAREAALAEREALVALALGGYRAGAPEQSESAVARLTRAPFNMARSVFGGKKSD